MDDNKNFCQSIENATLKILLDMEKKMETSCLVVERIAKQKANADNGHLRASITHKVNTTTTGITGSIYSNLDYAPYLEKGTGIYAEDGNGRKTPWNWGNKGSGKWKGRRGWQGSRPHPFLEPARDESKNDVANILGGKK